MFSSNYYWAITNGRLAVITYGSITNLNSDLLGITFQSLQIIVQVGSVVEKVERLPVEQTIGEAFREERLDDEHQYADQDQREEDVKAVDREERFDQDAHFEARFGGRFRFSSITEL